MVPARIACLDLDTFFVSVERLHDPSLVGKPVIVGHVGGRGVVTSASYEARVFGVKAGIPMSQALRLCPQATVVGGHFSEYSAHAKKVRAILDRYTPSVQTASIDEFFLDFAGCEGLYARAGDADGDATIERTIREMRQRIQDETGLPASAGVAATRPLAKMASGFAKPAGVRFVRRGEEYAFVRDLPVRKYPGIGPVAEQRLVDMGVRTLGDLLDEPGDLAESVRRATFPDHATALGADRPAFHEHDERGRTDGSLSNERTFHVDVDDVETLRAQLCSLSERVCWRARSRGVLARTITLKLRYSDFETITRSHTVPATNADARVLATVMALFAANRARKLPIRLLGIQLSNLVLPPPQLALPFVRTPPAASAVDAVRSKFGYDAIRLGLGR